MKTTTLGAIKRHLPCADGWKTLTAALGTRARKTEVSYLYILEINGLDEAIWALRCDRVLDLRMQIIVAEHVLNLWEAEYPNDDRPRRAIEAKRTYLADPSEENRRAMVAALAAAWEAARDVARPAARDAASAAALAAASAAARDAAWDAARDAAWPAALAAASAAAWNAASVTTWAAASAAWDAASAAEREWQRDQFVKLVSEEQ